jgi:hypothetical protein
MALLVVMYKTPHDAAAFDKHYFEKHIPLPKKIPGLRKMRSQPQAPWRRLRDRPTITWWHSCTTTTSRLFKKPSPAPKGKRPLPTYRPLQPAAPTYSCLTHTPGVIRRRGIRTPERKPLRCSLIPDRRLDAAILDGFWRWTFRNSKGPQQDRADEYKYGAHRQYIELRSKVHSSHLHQSCAGGKASRTPQNAKANLLLRCRRICCATRLHEICLPRS